LPTNFYFSFDEIRVRRLPRGKFSEEKHPMMHGVALKDKAREPRPLALAAVRFLAGK
jgi:hypothetical protein